MGNGHGQLIGDLIGIERQAHHPETVGQFKADHFHLAVHDDQIDMDTGFYRHGEESFQFRLVMHGATVKAQMGQGFQGLLFKHRIAGDEQHAFA